FVSNLLDQIPRNDKAAIPSISKIYGVKAHSLEKWIHYRDLFSQDKTALKFSLFGESALRRVALEDRCLLQLEKNSMFKPPAKRRRIQYRAVRSNNLPDHEMVERVMSFYMLSPAVLDCLPLRENVQVLESAEFAHRPPVEKLLYDLESIIINKCEVCQFQDMFPGDAARVCFGPALMNRSGRLRALYQLPLRDVLAAATEDNSHLRSKAIILPAYFDTAYDGAQPIVPARAACALVNSVHAGSTNRDRQRAKTMAKIIELLKHYGATDPPDEMRGCEQETGEGKVSDEAAATYIGAERRHSSEGESYFVYEQRSDAQHPDAGSADPSVPSSSSSREGEFAEPVYEIHVKEEVMDDD
ncbi:hypothetical protein BIW11_09060, partial [Tropilaelaps mercedesae]